MWFHDGVPDHPTDQVILHIGTGKTGTTTIQHLLRLSRPALADVGVLYPITPGPVRHTKLGLSFRSDDDLATMPAWKRMRAQDPERFRRRVHRKLRKEIAEADLPRVLFSDEALYGFRGDILGRSGIHRRARQSGAHRRLPPASGRSPDQLLPAAGEGRRDPAPGRLGDDRPIVDVRLRAPLADWRQGMDSRSSSSAGSSAVPSCTGRSKPTSSRLPALTGFLPRPSSARTRA